MGQLSILLDDRQRRRDGPKRKGLGDDMAGLGAERSRSRDIQRQQRGESGIEAWCLPPDEFTAVLNKIFDTSVLMLWFGQCEFKWGQDGAMHIRTPTQF